ncbi:MAG TPA: class I SAM-dependent methyltransferase [Thermoanaerobaculia bacterium]|nr:class I SAM-dependent methyltransferase [Thermoanaerobaculia bacterium]
MDREVAERLAHLYTRRSLQGYARWKVRSDRAYSAVLAALRERNRPLADVGCGIGLLAFFLREHGFTAPIVGIDFDQRKIDVARAASRYDDLEFVVGDARDAFPPGHDVVLLDVLHYFDRDSQQKILANAAHADVVVIRQGIRDGSWRYRLTAAVDGLARVARWMKAERLNFPSREEIVAAFAGFDAEIRPLWGRTPYNGYLFVFRRVAEFQSDRVAE